MAIQLNASDIHAVAIAPSGYVNRSAPQSLTCWINSSVWNSVGVVASMVSVSLSGTTGIQIGTRGSATQVDIWSWGGATCVSSTGFTPSNGAWFHVAYTYDGTNNLLYINGVLNSSSTNAQVAGLLNEIYINGYPTGGSAETSAALVDDVAYYNRALSAAEVQTMAALQGYKDGIVVGLLARYCLNENSPGSTMVSSIDYSGNGNPLSVQGTGAPITYIAGITSTNRVCL